jgi:hypothetical protein
MERIIWEHTLLYQNEIVSIYFETVPAGLAQQVFWVFSVKLEFIYWENLLLENNGEKIDKLPIYNLIGVAPPWSEIC